MPAALRETGWGILSQEPASSIGCDAANALMSRHPWFDLAGRQRVEAISPRTFCKRLPEWEMCKGSTHAATDTGGNVSTTSVPLRPLIEGPAAWIGSDMREREAEWSYHLSTAEIAEIRNRRQEGASPRA